MQKLIVFLIITFFLIFCFGFSQTRSGEIIYKAKVINKNTPSSDSIKLENPELKAQAKNALHKDDIAIPFLVYHMIFNRNEALFEREKGMENDNGLNLKTASLSIGILGKYYTNTKKHLNLHQHHFLEEDWILKRNIDSIKWQIRDETKKINGYTCKKAVARVPLNDIKKEKITAWFTPNLPFQFGPMEFGGLPGLILGLQIRHYYLYADKISLSNKEKHIDKPNKGMRVDPDEYYKEIEKGLPWNN